MMGEKKSMKVLSTTELEQYIKSLYNKAKAVTETEGIFIPLKVYFRENRPQDPTGSFCFSDSQGYHFREIERGIVKRDILTQNLFEITFLAVEDQVFWISVNYEAKHRISSQDPRRLIFSKRLQIYSAIGSEYAAKAAREIQETLGKVPFQDELFEN